MIITISGTPGSGKTTVAKKLTRKLKWKRFDFGQFTRQLSRERRMTLAEFTILRERDPSIDREIDARQAALIRSRSNYVVEGRMSFHFIPSSLKIFLYASPGVGAQRIFQEIKRSGARKESKRQRTIAQVQRSIVARMNSDQKRYQKLYQVNPFLQKHYDAYLDTSKLTPRQVFDRVWKVVELHRKKKRFPTRLRIELPR